MKKIADKIYELVSPTMAISYISDKLLKDNKCLTVKEAVKQAQAINKRVAIKLLAPNVSIRTITETLNYYQIKADFHLLVGNTHIATPLSYNCIKQVKKYWFGLHGIKSRKDLSNFIRAKLEREWDARYDEPMNIVTLNNAVQIDVTRLYNSNTIKTIYRLLEIFTEGEGYEIYITTDKLGTLP